MFIGLCGDLCAGKREVAKYLETKHGFKVLKLVRAIDRTDESENRPGKVDGEQLEFHRAEDLLYYITKRWRERFVTTDIWDEGVLEVLLRRPSFILVSVEGPILTRWERYKQRCESLDLAVPTLEDFVALSDKHLYSPSVGLASLVSRASIKLVNQTSSISALHAQLDALNLTDESRLRPSWDLYFMQLASLAAKRSNCMKRRVGCVLVREKRVISTGYNGAPRGMLNCNEGGCGRCNSGVEGGVGLATCLCLHAEENALLEAGRERVGTGAILYCNTCPCLTCSIKIVQVGISEVVYSQGYSMDTKTAAVLKEGGVRLRQFSPDGLVNLV
ncbi:Deoxycytidine monophosphate (dCMP) deaminase [Rhizina undulata]